MKSRKLISFKTCDSKLFLVVSEGKWKKLLFQIMLFLISYETFQHTHNPKMIVCAYVKSKNEDNNDNRKTNTNSPDRFTKNPKKYIYK